MTVSGPADADYTVYASTNLTVWTPVKTLVSPAQPFLWSDPEAANYPKRFYRVRLGQ